MPWDGKKANQHRLVRIVRRQKRVLGRARYPRRSSKYANHLYRDQQHVVLLALRQHFRKSYRDFCEIIEVCTPILEELGLRRVPHWTTLHKFSKRAETRRRGSRFSIWQSTRPVSARRPRAPTTPGCSRPERAGWEDTGEVS